MSGKKISIKLLSLLMSLVMIVTSIPLGAIATYAVTTSKELDTQLSYEKRYNGKKVSPETQAVYDFICEKYGKNMLTAQQESTWVDNNPDWEMDYLMENTGRLPAIRGFDYIGSNVGETTAILTDNDFKGVNKRAIEWWRKGGIVTICWHTGSNFIGGYQNSKKDSPPDWDKVLTDGTPENIAFKQAMGKGAEALQELRDAGVPVLWRPFHEFDGGWFWWGKFKKNALTTFTGNWDIDNEKFKKLWKMMYDLYTNEYHLNNLIWVYGYSQVTSDPSGLYPGDEYVDILGPDNYEKNIVNLFNKVNGVSAAKRPICLHECGTNPTQDQWNQAPYSYFMTWHTGWLTGSERTSKNTVDSLKQLYNSDLAITLDELPAFPHKHKAGKVKQEDVKSPTCTEEGSYNDVTICAYEKCKEIVSTEAKTIPALGHSFTNYVFDNNSNESFAGTKTAKCDRCDATNTIAFDPDADKDAIKDAMTAFENKLKNGGVYTNLPNAYKAYVEASKAYDSFFYGGDTSVAVNEKAKELNDAVNKMQVWKFARKYANNNKGIWMMNNSSDPMKFDDSYTPSSANTGLGERVTYYSHQNILYAGIANKDFASLEGSSMRGWLRYQPITMMYDGDTLPQAPIMVVYGSYITAPRFTLAITLTDDKDNSLKLVNKWLFSRDSSYGQNFDWHSAYLQKGGTPNCISQSLPGWQVQLGKSGWGSWTTTPGMANLYYFDGSFSDNEYLKTIIPTINFYTNDSSGSSKITIPQAFTASGDTSTPETDYRIHVINYKAIIDSAKKYKDSVSISNIESYKEGGLSNYLSVVDSTGNELNNFDPNTYFTSATSSTEAGTNNYQACADEISRICGLVNDVKNSTKTPDVVSRYPALRTAMDDTMATYNAGRTSEYSVKSYNAFKAAYEEAMGVMSQVVNLGYENESLGKSAETAAKDLETAFKALAEPCDVRGYDHTWNLVKATTPATCTKNGFGDFICTECEEPDSHEITKLGHNLDKAYNQDKSRIFEYCTLCKEKFGDGIDLTAYNAQVALANDALGRTDKYKDLSNLSTALSKNVANIDSTQDEVDSYCKTIETAYNALELKEYSLTFKIMVGDKEKSTVTKTYKYGDVVPLNVGSEYNPYKWTREGYSSRIANATNEVSVVVYGETTVVAHCDDNAQAPAEQHKVTVYNKFNKPINYLYVGNNTKLTFNGANITVGEGETAYTYTIEKIPFYQVTGYTAGTTQLGSSATYTVNGDIGVYPVYSAQQEIKIELDKTNPNSNIRFSDDAKALSKTVIWDQKITVEADQDVVWYVNNIAVAKGTSYTFRASNSIKISAQVVETEKGSTTITYADYDSENNKIRYAVSSYKSKDFVIAEQGIIVGTSTKSQARFNKDVIIKNGKKFVASKTTDTGDQFSYSISLGSSASVIKTICAVSYVKYENIDTPIYSDINYIYLD